MAVLIQQVDAFRTVHESSITATSLVSLTRNPIRSPRFWVHEYTKHCNVSMSWFAAERDLGNGAAGYYGHNGMRNGRRSLSLRMLGR
jgi:hypothetical protein